MIRFVMLVGEPATGKSTLIRELMGCLATDWELRTPTYVPHHFSPTLQTMVLGRYDDKLQKYPGTDRMSMAAQPHVLSYVRSAIDSGYCSRVLCEGDRLGNRSMIMALKAMPLDLRVIRMCVDPDVLARRRASERFDQNGKFWASRFTKLENMRDVIDTHWNVPGDDTTELAKHLLELVCL